MKNIYKDPRLEIINFSKLDVIQTSPGGEGENIEEQIEEIDVTEETTGNQ